MLTIGQLARHAGVSAKAVRVYHAKGLLPEPARDASGYHRYDAQAVIDLARIVTLAQAGVPLARIPEVLNADEDALDRIDAELRDRIRQLEQRRARLRDLDRPDRLCLPPEAIAFMDRLKRAGLSARHENAIRDGWILACALAPDVAHAILPSRTALLDDPEYVAVLRAYDEAIEWSPDDPRLEAIADAAATLGRRMTLPSDLPDFRKVPRQVVELLATHLDSPAWQRIDQLVAQRISEAKNAPSEPSEAAAPRHR
ncbi:MerR family transcriptional regulator [Amycolatopsis sp. Poz14]|uniref:MerR family transcriptional regulator n=1 Tax=Amycolatopsis sp. Poz14 TaxID=1447705 RepID=UPI001EE88E62|nr:MerR family transcriptional regulator [Amycolatopsis sp. Poz14]MCG3756431.1 MerR family transcriptional regulator [Amycolatopsis sp. Poz14]